MTIQICKSKTKMSLLLAAISAAILITTFLLSGCGTSKPINQTDMPVEGNQVAVLTTSKGVIKILLLDGHAPEMVKNFTTLAKEGKYDGIIFHRVIKDFMIQTGDFENQNGTGGYSYKGPGTMLKDEIHPDLSHIRGAVSMANRGPNRNGSQFFIVQKDSTFLDGKYSIFGQVYEGMNVVDKIASVETDVRNKPFDDVVLEKVEILRYKDASTFQNNR